MKKQIESRADIKVLVDVFYTKVKDDALLGPVFSHVHWPDHLNTMYSFWASLLLGEATYRGNPLQKHLPLSINASHFEGWLRIWRETIDELFTGEIAEEAKMRGHAIAQVFQHRMRILEEQAGSSAIRS